MFPSHYPATCPPDDAIPTAVSVYRFVRRFPCCVEDFLLKRDECPEKDFAEKECEACGLSVYLDIKVARERQKQIPGFKKRFIATAKLCPEHGLIKATFGPDHQTWWVPTGLAPWTGLAAAERDTACPRCLSRSPNCSGTSDNLMFTCKPPGQSCSP